MLTSVEANADGWSKSSSVDPVELLERYSKKLTFKNTYECLSNSEPNDCKILGSNPDASKT